ncbi:MAG: serine/threonine protein kinase [Victivallales bacterium]|jgi:serine/threonine-protein kinase|nr:serine/threonine protein kinase [Victivallales bacterium]
MPQTDSEPIKIFCRGCKAKLDVSGLEPFSQIPCPECGTLLRIPMRFERYLLEKMCGRGGMSCVYRAIDPQLVRRVAVKILDSTNEDISAETEYFLKEAKIVSRLSHPGIIPVYNCGIWENRAFMTMRYMDNGSLERHLKAHTLPPVPVLLTQLAVIAEGLAYAQTRGVAHHDVKPGNILLSSSGEAKLGDFDLADVSETKGFSPVRGGFASPAYVSPERLFFGAEDYRGDIFSLGVTIYELLTGIPPFGVIGEPEELLERRNKKEYPPLRQLVPECSPELDGLIERMLSCSPEERPEYKEIIRILKDSAENWKKVESGPGTETRAFFSRFMKRFGTKGEPL